MIPKAQQYNEQADNRRIEARTRARLAIMARSLRDEAEVTLLLRQQKSDAVSASLTLMATRMLDAADLLEAPFEKS